MSGQSNAVDNSYPFLKQASLFKPKKELKLEYEDKNHQIFELQKKEKSGGSLQREEGAWIEIHNSTVRPECKQRLNRIEVCCGELMGLLDLNLPKYRIIADEKGQHVISKKIEGGTEFFEFFNEHMAKDYLRNEDSAHYHYIGDQFQEGMGRNIMGKFFYGENDFHFGNAFVDPDGYFKSIDHDKAFSTLTQKLHRPALLKKSNPTLTLADWETLPIVKYYKASYNWEWNDPGDGKHIPPRPYSRALSRNQEFLNEKYFSTFKLLTTGSLQKILVDYHIEDKHDKDKMVAFLHQQRESLKQICHQSRELKDYLQIHSTDILYTIIFETHEFFKRNRHYLPHNLEEAIESWNLIATSIINQFDSLTNELGLAISPTEMQKIIQFSEKIHHGKKSDHGSVQGVLQRVENFYHNQKMQTFEHIAQKSRRDLHQRYKDISISEKSLFQRVCKATKERNTCEAGKEHSQHTFLSFGNSK